MIGELTKRFSQASFSFLQEAEKAIIDSCNGMHVELSESFHKTCEGDLDVNLLTIYTIATAARCHQDSQSAT